MHATGERPDDTGYATLLDALEAHGALLSRSRDTLANADDPARLEAFFDDARRFIRRAVLAGEVIEPAAERQALQSQIDYWVGLLRRHDRPVPHQTLAPCSEPDLADVSCPYPGLRALREDEMPFGREKFVATCLARLQSSSMLAIVGASGTGKSSVAIAGVLPQLKAQGWNCLPRSTPGTDALASLAALVGQDRKRFRSDPQALLAALNALGSERTVCFVDQFEELATLESDPAARKVYLANLAALANAPGQPHRLIVTMRSEFGGMLDAYPEFAKLLRGNAEHLYKMEPAELRAAIEGPARKVGLRFEEGLVEELVEQIAGDPSGLPLLQFTLSKLWATKQRSRVTWEGYRKLGGVREALANEAEVLYRELPPNSKEIARDIFLALVVLDDKGEPLRKRVPRRVLDGLGSPEWVSHIVEKYRKAGLLVASSRDAQGEDQIELAHEALARYWDRFTDWLKERRAFLEGRVRFARQARDWDGQGRLAAGLVVRHNWLDEARRYKDLDDVERKFLAQNERAAARERNLSLSLKIFAVITVLGGFFAYSQHQLLSQARAREQALTLMDGARAAPDWKGKLELSLDAYRKTAGQPILEVTSALQRAMVGMSDRATAKEDERKRFDPRTPIYVDANGPYIDVDNEKVRIPHRDGWVDVKAWSGTSDSEHRVAVLRYPKAPDRSPNVKAAPEIDIYLRDKMILVTEGASVSIPCPNQAPLSNTMFRRDPEASPNLSVLTYTCMDGAIRVAPLVGQDAAKRLAETAGRYVSNADSIFFQRDENQAVIVAADGSLRVLTWALGNPTEPWKEEKFFSDFFAVYDPQHVAARTKNGQADGFAVLDKSGAVTYFELDSSDDGEGTASWFARVVRRAMEFFEPGRPGDVAVRAGRLNDVFRLSVQDPKRDRAFSVFFSADGRCLFVKREDNTVDEYLVDRRDIIAMANHMLYNGTRPPPCALD